MAVETPDIVATRAQAEQLELTPLIVVDSLREHLARTLPPYMLASFLTATLKCEVYLIGVQPADTTLGAPLTPVVGQAVLTAADTLASILLPYAVREAQDAPLH